MYIWYAHAANRPIRRTRVWTSSSPPIPAGARKPRSRCGGEEDRHGLFLRLRRSVVMNQARRSLKTSSPQLATGLASKGISALRNFAYRLLVLLMYLMAASACYYTYWNTPQYAVNAQDGAAHVWRHSLGRFYAAWRAVNVFERKSGSCNPSYHPLILLADRPTESSRHQSWSNAPPPRRTSTWSAPNGDTGGAPSPQETQRPLDAEPMPRAYEPSTTLAEPQGKTVSFLLPI